MPRRWASGGRFHRCPQHQPSAVGDPALQAAGTVGKPEIAASFRIENFVVHARTRKRGQGKSAADLHLFDGLDAHQRGGEAPIQPAVPVDIAAQSRREAAYHDFKDDSEGRQQLLVGRFGNLFNQEAYGVETRLPWTMYIDGVWRHPTFLYRPAWNLLAFGLLLYTTPAGVKKRRGPPSSATWSGIRLAVILSRACVLIA